jgi:16S rRNA (cytidine1402-2'-O)-methyltransferase
MSAGTVYLIPTTLGDVSPEETIPSSVNEVVNTISHYVVENEKHARRYLKKLNISKPLDQIKLLPLNKRTRPEEISRYLSPAVNGFNMGVISEAGCPGVADPGADIVKLAHEKGLKVVPLSGPSSILMSLMASGMNGQQFTFHGYLPKERKDRVRKIREIEKNIRFGTQIFMDTPYRNMHVLEDIINTCSPDSLLCIACDITLPTEMIRTQPVKEWKKLKVDLNKRPCMFLLGY